MSTPFTIGPMPLRSPRTARFPLRKRRRKMSPAEAANLHLVSAGTGVPIKLAVQSPTLMLLAVEDLCWQLAVSDVTSRRPAFWRRADRASWHEERAHWEAKRARLAAMAHEAITDL